MKQFVSVKEAAKHFRVHRTTVRSWIRDGCPCVEVGSVGRGNGSLLDIEAVAAWRVGRYVPIHAEHSADEILALVATALFDALKRDGLAGTVRPAERIMLAIYERLYRNLKQTPLELSALPEELKRVCSIYVDSVERGTFQRR